MTTVDAMCDVSKFLLPSATSYHPPALPSLCVKRETMFAVRPIAASFQRVIVNSRPASARSMATIVDGVDFDTVAREWRCKWSGENDKQSLAEAQKALNEVLADVKAVDGFKKVDRVVCGGCLDFKVITSLPAGDKFAAWEASGFAPEENFLKKLESIEGISVIETQTYTIMPM